MCNLSDSGSDRADPRVDVDAGVVVDDKECELTLGRRGVSRSDDRS